MNNITIEEVKDILKCSIDETTNMNEAIERTLQHIYLKGWNDATKTGWIPVSKEFPKTEQYALITVHNQTKMCWYQNGVFLDGEQNAYTKENEELVAWMPLPEPYKLSEIPTGSDDELYSDCIDAFKEYALGRK